MTVTYLKSANVAPQADQAEIAATVDLMLRIIETEGEDAVLRYARELDGWTGDVIVPRSRIDAAASELSQQMKDDIAFAHDNIRRFAEAQKATISDSELEILPGMIAGQKHLPVSAAGCYVPGGRYSHVASAIMTVTTAKVAGVPAITACSPPRGDAGIPAPILYAMDLCGADHIICVGGVQALAAMAFGHFGLPKADILVGPGNAFVAEAKRQLFGRVGIDMIAGPTDCMVLADRTADAKIVASDLVGQAEHGHTSPVWLVTNDRNLAVQVLALVPDQIAALPEPNRTAATHAWRDYGEVILCDTPEEMAAKADEIAPEHLQVQADDIDWWLDRLSAYGSLFLGEETTVAMGDKASGPNHVLPTSGAARYTGGLSIHKFMKTVTWQRATRAGMRPVAEATARLSRLEGMEGHARSADIRLKKFFTDG